MKGSCWALCVHPCQQQQQQKEDFQNSLCHKIKVVNSKLAMPKQRRSFTPKLLYSLCLICDLLFEKSVQKDWKGPSRHLPQRSPTLGHIWYSPPLDFFFLTRLGVQLVIVLIPVLQFISTILSPFGIPTIVNCLCVYQVMESLFPDHTQISSSGLGGLGHEREHIMIYRFSS